MKKGIDYIGVGVGAIIINREGRIFLTLRGRKARNEVGKWECPGGSVEFGETIKNALKREIREEFGFEIEPVQLFVLSDHIIPQEKQHWIAPSYFCKVIKGNPQIREPDKCEKIGWFTIDEIRKLPLSIVTQHEMQELEIRNNKMPSLYV